MIKALRKWIFGSEHVVMEREPEKEEFKYICLTFDPVNTVNKIDTVTNPTWNMDKVHEGLMSGMLRYATKQEVANAIRDGKLKS